MAILRAFGFLVLASLPIGGRAEEDATPICSSSLLQSKADRKSVRDSDVHLSETLKQSAADPSLLDKVAEGAEKCVTVGQEGVGPNVQCVFPFISGGVKRSNCTMFEWDRPWCSTKVNAATGMSVPGQWGTCGAQCKAEVCVTAGPAGDGVGPGVACKFPFRFNGILHTRCTTEEWTKPWCSTQVKEDGTSVKGQWGNCGNSCPTRNYSPATTTTTTTVRIPIVFMPIEQCGAAPAEKYIYNSRQAAADACTVRGCQGLATIAQLTARARNKCAAGWLADGKGLWVKKAFPQCGGNVGYNPNRRTKVGAYCHDCPTCPGGGGR